MTKKKGPIDNIGTSWLSMLQLELATIDKEDLVEPFQELGPNDNDVGELPEDLHRLWTLFLQTEEKSTRTLVDSKYAVRKGKENDSEDLLMRALEYKNKAEIMHSILFVCLREKFKLWNPRIGVGIRVGRRVVSYQSNNNPLLDLLQHLEGNG